MCNRMLSQRSTPSVNHVVNSLQSVAEILLSVYHNGVYCFKTYTSWFNDCSLLPITLVLGVIVGLFTAHQLQSSSLCFSVPSLDHDDQDEDKSSTAPAGCLAWPLAPLLHRAWFTLLDVLSFFLGYWINSFILMHIVLFHKLEELINNLDC